MKIWGTGPLCRSDGRRNSAKSFPEPACIRYVLCSDWISIAAAFPAVSGIMLFNNRPGWLRLQRALLCVSLLLMVWTANGLPFDLLHLTPLMPPGVDWPGLITRSFALAAAVIIARMVLAFPTHSQNAIPPASWYGYAAFVLALPYPVLRTYWAFGGSVGLEYPGAAGIGFALY